MFISPKRIRLVIFGIILIGLFFMLNKAHNKRIFIWLPNYIKYEITKQLENNVENTKHIMFLMVDHHEITDIGKELKFLERLINLSIKHTDADGKNLQYTFFYPYDHFFLDEFNPEVIQLIRNKCAKGYGDLELHWHLKDETSTSFREKLKDAKRRFNELGALITIDGKEAFAFIHGNWALDNSIVEEDGRNRSGVNNELDILREEGCYADFTFPAFGTDAQPRIVNSIYYAVDDPNNPKSYDTGFAVEAGNEKECPQCFMIFPGIISILPFISNKIIYIDRSNIQDSELPSPRRADNWVKNGISIKGKPDWLFIKLHMHGRLHPDAILGNDMDRTLTYLKNKYNDGKKFQLHYVTAREAYNIVKAAEAGLSGNPHEFRDFIIKPYKYSIAN